MFENRREAGRALARALTGFAGQDLVIYALPRGGLPVAAEVARRLKAPLDILLVRKLGAPHQPELAIGAVVDGAAPTLILNEDVINEFDVSEAYILAAEHEALRALEQRRQRYHLESAPISPKDKTAIIIDDGLATGATMEAAISAVRQAGPRAIIAAVPVAPIDTIARLRPLTDELVCLATPTPFFSVGEQYARFPQLSDDDAVAILQMASD